MEPRSSLPHSHITAICPWASWIQSIPPHPSSWRSILILSSHLCLGFQSCLLPSGLPTQALFTPLVSPVRATFPSHLILLDWITRAGNTDHKVFQYATLTTSSLPLPSWARIDFSAHHSHTYLAYVSFWMWETKSETRRIQQTKLHFTLILHVTLSCSRIQCTSCCKSAVNTITQSGPYFSLRLIPLRSATFPWVEVAGGFLKYYSITSTFKMSRIHHFDVFVLFGLRRGRQEGERLLGQTFWPVSRNRLEEKEITRALKK